MSKTDAVPNKIETRFSFEPTDLPVMQRSVDAVIVSIERQIADSLANGLLNDQLMRALLRTLAHASARAQQEYAEVRDDLLPAFWTEVAFK